MSSLKRPPPSSSEASAAAPSFLCSMCSKAAKHCLVRVHKQSLSSWAGVYDNDNNHDERVCEKCVVGYYLPVYRSSVGRWELGTIQDFDMPTQRHQFAFADEAAEWMHVDEDPFAEYAQSYMCHPQGIISDDGYNVGGDGYAPSSGGYDGGGQGGANYYGFANGGYRSGGYPSGGYSSGGYANGARDGASHPNAGYSNGSYSGDGGLRGAEPTSYNFSSIDDYIQKGDMEPYGYDPNLGSRSSSMEEDENFALAFFANDIQMKVRKKMVE